MVRSCESATDVRAHHQLSTESEPAFCGYQQPLGISHVDAFGVPRGGGLSLLDSPLNLLDVVLMVWAACVVRWT